MDKRQILQKIVDEEGSCDWIEADRCDNQYICSTCPLSKLVKKDDLNYYSCIDALKVIGLPTQEQNKRYKETAERLLLDISVEDMLE